MSKHYVIGLAALLIVALVGIAPMASSAGIAEATAELAQSAAAFDIEAIKAAAMQFAEDNSALTIDIAQALWNYAEIGLNEYSLTFWYVTFSRTPALKWCSLQRESQRP